MILLALTRWVLRHRLFVVLGWVAMTIAGAVAVGPVTGAMSQDFGSLPGRPAYETNQQILRTYGNGGAVDPLVLVVTLPAGLTVDSPGVRGELASALQRVAGGSRIVSYADSGDRGFVSADGRTTFALLQPPAGTAFPPYAEAVPAVEQRLAGVRVAGAPVRLTGMDALFTQSSDASGPGLLLETIVAGVAALVVLAWVFGSALAVLPLVMSVVAILVTFLAVGGLTAVTEVSFVVQFLVGLIGLGVAIDYALLITTRWREERERGALNLVAVERAMRSAGAAVVLSGVTVAVALAMMVLMPVPFLRSMGLGGMLIPLFSVLVAITLLPVLLATVGPRLDRLGLRRRWRVSAGGWFRWAGFVARRPLAVALVSTALLAALVVPVSMLRLGAPQPAAIAASGPARETLDRMTEAGIGAGVLSPVYLLTTEDPTAVAARARGVPGVRAALAPEQSGWRRDGSALVVVLVDQTASTSVGREVRDRVRQEFDGVAGVRLGGAAAQGRDFVDAVYGSAPLVLGLIVFVTLVLLVRSLRSIVLAVKAMLLNLLSVTATFGLVVLAWQQGWLSEPIWGIEATGSLTEWVPVMVFAFLFGLSMDYEVFILTRIREEYDATADTSGAVVLGIARTGRLVTSAALILFLSFVSLAATPGTEVKIFATALGLGILLDATIVRALLVPALVILLGRWNWWLPSWWPKARSPEDLSRLTL